MSAKNLLYLASLYVFYVVYNTILRFGGNGHNYSYCNKIPGCEFEYGFRSNCTVCMVMGYYSLYKLNQVKNDPLELLNYAEMFFEDLQKICEYDETIC